MTGAKYQTGMVRICHHRKYNEKGGPYNLETPWKEKGVKKGDNVKSMKKEKDDKP